MSDPTQIIRCRMEAACYCRTALSRLDGADEMLRRGAFGIGPVADAIAAARTHTNEALALLEAADEC